jgi:hypothetical protein
VAVGEKIKRSQPAAAPCISTIDPSGALVLD